MSSLSTTTSLYGLKHSESLYGNYHAYLCDARAKIQTCTAACANWVYPYDGQSPPYEAFSVPPPERRTDTPSISRSDDRQISSNGDSDGLSSLETVNIVEFQSTQNRTDKLCGNESSEHSEGNTISNPLQVDNREEKSHLCPGNDLSLPSVEESSGYESFAPKSSSDSSPENEASDDTAATSEEGMPPSISDAEVTKSSLPHPANQSRESSDSKSNHEGSYMDVFKTTPSIGIIQFIMSLLVVLSTNCTLIFISFGFRSFLRCNSSQIRRNA